MRRTREGPEGGWRAEKRKILWRPRFFWNRGGRLAARHMRIRSEAIAHQKCAKAPNPSACFFAVIVRSPGRAFAWVRISFLRYRASRYLSAKAKDHRRTAPSGSKGPGTPPSRIGTDGRSAKSALKVAEGR
jgi:hypothetical protein